MHSHLKINNERFSVRFCFIMKGLGITTVGSAGKFLNKCNPCLKIQDTRVHHLLKEYKLFISEL